MPRSSVLALSLGLALAACGKKEATPTTPAPPPAGGKMAPARVNDPEIVCRGGEAGRTVFSIELGYPDGCAPIPSEYDGQVRELEITLEGAPIRAYLPNPVDLTARGIAFEPNGCGASIVLAGAIGTLELAVAVTEYGDSAISGTGRWTPTGGAACDLTIGGTYSDYGQQD